MVEESADERKYAEGRKDVGEGESERRNEDNRAVGSNVFLSWFRSCRVRVRSHRLVSSVSLRTVESFSDLVNWSEELLEFDITALFIRVWTLSSSRLFSGLRVLGLTCTKVVKMTLGAFGPARSKKESEQLAEKLHRSRRWKVGRDRSGWRIDLGLGLLTRQGRARMESDRG